MKTTPQIETKRASKLLYLGLLLLIHSAPLEAAPTPQGNGFSLYTGLGVSGDLSSQSDLDHSGALSGFGVQLPLQASFYSQKVAYDFGVGWTYHHLSTDQVRILTRSGLGLFSARYRFQSLEVGAFGQVWFGNQIPLGQTKDSVPVFLGLGIVKGHQLQWAGQPAWRWGIQALVDLTLSTRVHGRLLATLEMGIPLFAPTPPQIKKETIEKRILEKVVIYTFDDQFVHFKTNEDTLMPRSYAFVKDLGATLTQQNDNWEKVLIKGHTDSRGEFDFNQDLSSRRAQQVKVTLESMGVQPEKVLAQGFGEAQPIDPAESEEAWSRNRRVEIEFEGVKDPKIFRDEIQKIRARHMTVHSD
jgi:outer membrane protein OmpA-like peptidoglycan-associated protein